MKMKNLNLGCNIYKLPGFINIDASMDYAPDIVMDATDMSLFKNDEIDLIFAGHFLEHLTYEDSMKCLKECYRILKPGAEMIIIIPDLHEAYQSYILNKISFDRLEEVILGAERDHKQIFIYEKLGNMAYKIGFSYKDLELHTCPYILVSDINKPMIEPIQSGMVLTK